MLPPIARRFVAGETVPEALDHARTLDERGVGAILNLLGEHYDDPAAAASDRDAYLDLVADVAATGDRACISIKPSQVGLGVGRDVFSRNANRIVTAAAERDVFVWFDMEDHTTTDATLDVYTDLATSVGGGVGVCLQANLKRTPDDLQRLNDVPGKVRLVKGAYDPPPSIAYRNRQRVNDAYRNLVEQAFRDRDGGIAVGTHDPAMLDYAADCHDRYGTDYEIQMLMGVREDAQFDLAREHDVWQYVPFGEKWLSYFYRRVAERKENALFALRALLRG